VIEPIPVVAPQFNLKVRFQNQTSLYLKAVHDIYRPMRSSVASAMGFDANIMNATSFSLTPEQLLKSEANCTIGWIPHNFWNQQANGKLIFMEDSWAQDAKAILPLFYIDTISKGYLTDYKLGVEKEKPTEVKPTEGVQKPNHKERKYFWVARYQLFDPKIPDENILLFETQSMVDLIKKKEEDMIFERVEVFAQPTT
jgi:hypothetical protein